MQTALYGKHPGRGDFVQTGMEPQMLRGLETWLDASLSDARADLGELWEHAWKAAPILRFWIGEEVLGAVMCGVMAASQDRVGRRFPLLMLAVGAPDTAPMPPVIDASQDWYDRAEAHLRAVLSQPAGDGAADLLIGFPLPVVDHRGTQPGPPDFWAVLPGAALETLLTDVALTDHRRAAAARSYWWVAGDEMPVIRDVASAPDLAPATAEGPTVAKPPEPPRSDGDGAPSACPAVGVAAQDGGDSPFAGGGQGAGLFAPPEQAVCGPVDAVLPPARTDTPATAPPVLRPSRVHAGAGLPSGGVVAWFLRG